MKNDILTELFNYVDESPCCFWAVENLKKQLLKQDFVELKEKEQWKLKEGGKYFVTRNDSSIISFKIPAGDNWNGFLVTASHSDSPCFKVKENPEMNGAGVVQLNVEKYGGMLMTPWFDRPLSVAGRVVISDSKDKAKVKSILVNVDKNLLSIPNLAIHMNRDANDGHSFDVQSELMPVVSQNSDFKLKKIIAEQAGVSEEEILGYDLFLYNRDKAVLWGAEEEFISSPRLDDLECVWTTFKGFSEAENSGKILVHAVFDNEEVGSQSRQGAASTFMQDILRRISIAMGRTEEQYYQAVSQSMLVSADNAHAVHPNYTGKADPVNRPEVNHGPVIKFNASQKYTSDCISAGIFKKACELADVPYQVFTNNSNIAGGSTLGNISTSQVSFLSVDIGIAQWAMHSPNESAGSKDAEYMINAIKSFYKNAEV